MLFAKIRSEKACFTAEPNRRFISRSTTAKTGSRLRLNMPATSIRDLVLKDDDLVVGTHGRSFWILDDITPLRQLAAAQQNTTLFAPQRRDTRETQPAHRHAVPARGARRRKSAGRSDHQLLSEDAPASSPVVLEITDAAGQARSPFCERRQTARRRYVKINPPEYWIRPFQPLKNEAGMQRFVWDLKYPNPPSDTTTCRSRRSCTTRRWCRKGRPCCQVYTP